ncbi:hypothetical protein CN998_32735, partial [Bacillus cereus]
GGENPVDCQDADAPQRRGGLVRHNSIVLIGESGHQTAGSSYFLSDVSSVPCRARGLRLCGPIPANNNDRWPHDPQNLVQLRARTFS